MIALSLALSLVLCDMVTMNDITNETLSKNDANQFILMISSVISLGMGVMFFFQWVLYILYKKMYELRRTQNINLRFLGLSRRRLFSAYYLDYVVLLVPSFLFGVVFYVFISNMLFYFFDVNWDVYNIQNILIRSVLYLLVSVLSFTIMLSRSSKKNILEEINNFYGIRTILKGKKREKIYIFIRAISYICFFVSVAFVLLKGHKFVKSENLLYLFPLFLFFIVLKPIIAVLNLIMLALFEKVRLRYLWLSCLFDSNNLNRKITMMRFLVIGITIFLGLNMLFVSVREAAGKLVEKNVHYSFYTLFNQHKSILENNRENTIKANYYKVKYNNSNLHILGVEENYFRYAENIDIKDDLINEFSLEQGIIIFPDYYISKDDIGSEIEIKVEGENIKFKVVSGYRNNDLSRLVAFVPKRYLNKQLGLENGEFNAEYYLEGNVDDIDYDYEVVTKEMVKARSIKKSVQGTDLVEIISWAVLLSMIIFFMYFLSIDIEEFIYDIAKLKLIGVNNFGIYISYISKITINVLMSTTIAFISSVVFAKSLAYTMLGKQYFVGILFGNPELLISVVIIIIVLSVATIFFMTKKIMNGDFLYLISTK